MMQHGKRVVGGEGLEGGSCCLAIHAELLRKTVHGSNVGIVVVSSF